MLDVRFNQNVGWWDRGLRMVMTLALLYLGFGGYGGAVAGIVLAIAASLLALTALVGACPCYALLEINTRRRPQRHFLRD